LFPRHSVLEDSISQNGEVNGCEEKDPTSNTLEKSWLKRVERDYGYGSSGRVPT
jgi:hypothetical protein